MLRPTLRVSLLLVTATVIGVSAQSRDSWPHWRGPSHTGVAAGSVPLSWNDSENVRWKIEIPGRAFSTPVAQGDRLFLTTAIPTGTKAADAAAPGGGARRRRSRRGRRASPRGDGDRSGERQNALAAHRYHVATRTRDITISTGSFASNAPATDGQRVYAFFGSRGLYVYDLDGKPLWQKDFGLKMAMRLGFGEGSGTVVHGGRVYLQFDHQQEGFVVALNAADGKELWRAPRMENSSWSTPLVVEHNGARQLVVTADTKVKAYDTDTGKVVWEVAGLGTNPIPQPVQSGDTVLVMSGYRNPRLMAIRLGRTGDLTGTDAVVWESTRGTSYTASPALHENRLYVIADNGMLSVFNAATGNPTTCRPDCPSHTTSRRRRSSQAAAFISRRKRATWSW